MAGYLSSPNSSGLSVVPLTTLFFLLLLAVDALHFQLGRISYSDLIAPLLDPNDDRLRKTFTGINPIDDFLSTLLTMFMPIFTWEMPELSVFTLNFAGQIPAHLALMMIEGVRKGKAWGLTFTTTWMIVMQVFGYGVVMPAYYILDLIFSSHSPSDLVVQDPTLLQRMVFVPAVTLGYLLPSFLQVVTIGTSFHQIVLAIWQPFPIYIAFFIWIFSKVNLEPVPSGSEKEKRQTNLEGLRRIYSFAMTTGGCFHWTTAILIPILRRYIFSPVTADRLSLYNIFIPNGVHWYGPSTIAQASMQFLQWDMYCGGLAGLVWAVTLAKKAGAWDFGWTGVGEVLKDVASLGLPCAALKMLWRRDRAVMG